MIGFSLRILIEFVFGCSFKSSQYFAKTLSSRHHRCTYCSLIVNLALFHFVLNLLVDLGVTSKELPETWPEYTNSKKGFMTKYVLVLFLKIMRLITILENPIVKTVSSPIIWSRNPDVHRIVPLESWVFKFFRKNILFVYIRVLVWNISRMIIFYAERYVRVSEEWLLVLHIFVQWLLSVYKFVYLISLVRTIFVAGWHVHYYDVVVELTLCGLFFFLELFASVFRKSRCKLFPCTFIRIWNGYFPFNHFLNLVSRK